MAPVLSMGAPALTSVLASNISAAWKAYLDQGQQGGGKGAASGELTASVGVLCQQGLGPLLTAHCVDRLEVSLMQCTSQPGTTERAFDGILKAGPHDQDGRIGCGALKLQLSG